MKRDPQLSFKIPSHGGFRKKSGRKKLVADEPSHKPRAAVDKRTPIHINFKLIRQAPGLRTPKFMRALAKVFANARARGLRVQQYTIESNHIHLVCEADNKDDVSRGMSSLKVSIVWALRRIFMFHGKVFAGRYYAHVLRTPTEMRNALRYVLFNHAKHSGVALFADAYPLSSHSKIAPHSQACESTSGHRGSPRFAGNSRLRSHGCSGKAGDEADRTDGGENSAPRNRISPIRGPKISSP